MNMDLYETLKIVAPGTPLREGLDNIINARIGALIVLGNTKEVLDIVHGGFYINCEYTPSNIYELAKMDGAIILSTDLKRIIYANSQLLPCHHIHSKETGTRHKTAERVAKQTNTLVISISQKREIITLYKGNYKYILKDINEILNRTNQGVQTMEKYRKALDQVISTLTLSEFQNSTTLYDVVKAIQKMEMVLRIGKEIDIYISELGTEGRLFNMQVIELKEGVEEDCINLVRDYVKNGNENYISIYNRFGSLSANELLDLNQIANLLGYDDGLRTLDIKVKPKGYRILNKIPRIPNYVIENIINSFDSFQHIINASVDQMDQVEGVGQIRSINIVEGLKRYKEQFS